MNNVLPNQRTHAALFICLAIALVSCQDAAMKSLSGRYPAYEAVAVRGLITAPIILVWLQLRLGLQALKTAYWKWLLLRALLLSSAYLSYVMALAAMPMADAVAIYFTMPFFVAALARPFLHEKVPFYRWFSIGLGFVGVIYMLRPGQQGFQPNALFALYSAFGYAVGQMMGRPLSGRVAPLVIANYQNLVYLSMALTIGLLVSVFGPLDSTDKSLAFLTRGLVMPDLKDGLVLFSIALISVIGMMSFITAYQLADASFVAPFEYTAMLWAVLIGIFFFHDYPTLRTWTGLAIVAGAGLLMLVMDRRQRYRG